MSHHEYIGRELLGRLRVKQHRGACGETSFFLAEPYGQFQRFRDPFADNFDRDSGAGNVVIEIVPGGSTCGPRRTDDVNVLQPHRHILRCLEMGTFNDEEMAGTGYAVWEAWDETLAGLLARRGTLHVRDVAAVAHDIATALARYATEGLIHGDIRPERICRVGGCWKLAPVIGEKRDLADICNSHHDDIYQLGLLIVHCLAGGDAINADGAVSDEILGTLPEPWRTWVGRCLVGDGDGRCTAVELALIGKPMPMPVALDSVDRFEGPYHLKWRPVERGSVRVYRWQRGPRPVPGQLWLVDELERVAGQEPNPTGNEAVVHLLAETNCRIVVATVLGEAALIGESVMLTWASDVKRLRVSDDGTELVATWDWPDGAAAAQVVVKEGAFAMGPDDPSADSAKCFRAGYLKDGRFTIRCDRRTSVMYVTVYAIYRREEGWEQSSGQTIGARSSIRLTAPARLRYQIVKTSWLNQFFSNAAPYRLVLTSDYSGTVPDLTLAVGKDGPPTELRGGVAVLDVPCWRYERGAVLLFDIRLPNGVAPETLRLYPRSEPCDWLQLMAEHV